MESHATPEPRVIICGGRDWNQRQITYAALDRLHQEHNFTQVIQGAAKGADTLARDWANSRGIPVREFPADWYPEFIRGHRNTRRQLDRSAGHRRNQQMLDEGQPHLVIAFPGGRGTESMMQKARAAGVPAINLNRVVSWWKNHRDEVNPPLPGTPDLSASIAEKR